MAAVVSDVIVNGQDNTSQAFNSAARNAQTMGNKFRGVFRQMRAHSAQLGMQIQDVAVQLQGGTAAAVVFAQQGSQIASLFGPGGAILGALLAVGTALAGTLIPGLLRGSSEAEKFHNKIIQLAGGFEKLSSTAKKLAIASLVDEIADLNKEIIETEKKLGRVTQEFDVSKPIVFAFNKEMSLLSQMMEKYGNDSDDVNRALEMQKARMNVLAETLNKYLNPELQETSDHIKSVNEAISLLDGSATFADAITAIDELDGVSSQAAAEAENLASALDNQVVVAKKAADSFTLVDKPLFRLGRTFPMVTDETKVFTETFDKMSDSLKVGSVLAERSVKTVTDGVVTFGRNVKTVTEDMLPMGSSLTQVAETAKLMTGQVEESSRVLTDFEANAIRGVENGLVDLISRTSTAAEAFKSMARSIISDLIRMQVRANITSPLSTILSNIGGAAFQTLPGFTSVGNSSGRSSSMAGIDALASGGLMRSGRPTIVGENGPELMIPNRNATVVPNEQLSGGSNLTINMNISTGVSQTVRAEISNLMPQIAEVTKAAIADARMRGGSFSKAMVGS